MSADALSRNAEHDTPSRTQKLDDLYALIDKVETAMLTTIEPDGSLAARPMATLAAGSVAGNGYRPKITFMTSTETGKVDSLRAHPRVNVSYLREGTKEWVSVSGNAGLSRDSARIRSLYKTSWKSWLGDQGVPNDGGPDDPRILLIDVTAENVTYFKANAPRPVVLFQMAKSLLTGDPPAVGEVRHLDGGEARND